MTMTLAAPASSNDTHPTAQSLRRPSRSRNRLGEEVVLVPQDSAYQSAPANLRTDGSLYDLPRDSSWVHVCGPVSLDILYRVLVRCADDLRLLEVPPHWRETLQSGRAGDLSALLTELEIRGIGFYYARVIDSDIR